MTVSSDYRTLIEKMEELLLPILDASGAVLYSAGNTLKSSPVYLMGLNPGGIPEPGQPSVRHYLHTMITGNENAYIDEKWGTTEAGCHPLQRHVRGLFEAIGLSLRDTCCTNLIFKRSAGQDDAGYPGVADVCWPVHELMIDIVRPKALIVFGNGAISPYAYIRDMHTKLTGTQPEEDVIPSGHGAWSCCAFPARIASQQVTVIGLPHLSRYAIDEHKDVCEWVKSAIVQRDLPAGFEKQFGLTPAQLI